MANMQFTISGDPDQISQLLQVMAWIQSHKSINNTTELKIRLNKPDIEITPHNTTINNQFIEFMNVYKQFNTNPIFYIGNVFKEVK